MGTTTDRNSNIQSRQIFTNFFLIIYRSRKAPVNSQLPVPVKNLDQFTVDHDFQLFATDRSKGSVTSHVAQGDRIGLEGILAVYRKVMSEFQTTSGTKRQAFNTKILICILANPVQGLFRPIGYSHCQLTDISGSRKIGFKQGR